MEEQTATCLYLDGARANFTTCCHYPAIVVWDWQFKACYKDCNLEGIVEVTDRADRCCVVICALKMLQILTSRTEIAPINPKGLIYSFMMSVGNETIWEPVITNAINRCFRQNEGYDQDFDCEIIPRSIYSIVDCAYLENFLKCPKWNPYGLSECAYTHEFAKKCMGENFYIYGE
jgi:hypothetical protein